MPTRFLYPSFWRGLSALLWGLALASLGGSDIDRLVPLCVGAAVCDGLLAAIAPRAGGRRPSAADGLAALLGLGFGGLMAWQPLYSTLSYSFLLMLRWVQWLLSLGLLTLLRRPVGMSGDGPTSRASVLGGAVALLGAIALQLWPGAGMVERGLQAGGILVFWGVAQLVAAAGQDPS
jgi:hypothetical protein